MTSFPWSQGQDPSKRVLLLAVLPLHLRRRFLCSDGARRVAVVIPLDDSFPVRAEAAARLFNALTGRTPPRTSNALTAQQRRRLGLMLRGLDASRSRHCGKTIEAQPPCSQITPSIWPTRNPAYSTRSPR